ncbi:MAG: hypothetical protein JXO22_08345 [Phycisphaerae bacterium]|nr:hypothetical protein [Phycisphaerae bacterium]
MLDFVRILRDLDRRIVYAIMVAVLSVPFLWSYSLPIYPDRYTRGFFDTIEKIANDPVEKEKVVLVLSNWGPGTMGENEPQFIVAMRHLLRRQLKFVFLCSIADPAFHDAAMVAFEQAKQLEVERAARLGQPKPQWEYGVDYIDFGYKNALVFGPLARSIIVNAREFYGQDLIYGKSLLEDSFPILERYHGIEDVSAVTVISAGDESRDIVGLIKSDYPNLKIAPATMGIVANDLYPYVKSGHMFGLINSARAASEYRVLLDPEDAETTALDNAMSAGKTLLLILVIVGNLAYLITRRAQKLGKLSAEEKVRKDPLPPLPKSFMWTLFIAFTVVFIGTAFYEYTQISHGRAVPRERVARADEDPTAAYPDYERVTLDTLNEETAVAAVGPNRDHTAAIARTRYSGLLEQRIGDFIAVIMTLGVFAFCLGDNRFYRFIEAIIIGGSMAYLLDQVNAIIYPDWIKPIVGSMTDPNVHWANIFWVLLAGMGALWYFTYSKRYRWLNQMIVAFVMGLAIGPEFQKQISLVIPQISDSIQPLWPWAEYQGIVSPRLRVEHLFFLLFLVLSLTYFIFSFRPRGKAGNGVLTAGRIAMMVGFGAMFGNTVNTRLSWLAPRIEFLWQDWLQQLLAS